MNKNDTTDFLSFAFVLVLIASLFSYTLYVRSTPEYQAKKLKEGEALKKNIETYLKANNK